METVAKSGSLAAMGLAAVLLLGTGAAGILAQQRFTLAPTPMEAFAAQADAKTTWSKFVSRLEGGTAYATVSAVVLESATSTPKTMRGIRIELRHEGLRPTCNAKYVEWSVMCERELATAYVEESRLEDLRTSVLKGAAEVHAGHPAGITYYRSTGPSGSGLLVFGYSLRDRGLEEFAAVVSAAETELKNAPR